MTKNCCCDGLSDGRRPYLYGGRSVEIEARKRGDWIKVETRGSVGAKNTLTAEEIAQADVVIIAADIELDLSGFVGKDSIAPVPARR